MNKQQVEQFIKNLKSIIDDNKKALETSIANLIDKSNIDDYKTLFNAVKENFSDKVKVSEAEYHKCSIAIITKVLTSGSIDIETVENLTNIDTDTIREVSKLLMSQGIIEETKNRFTKGPILDNLQQTIDDSTSVDNFRKTLFTKLLCNLKA